MSELAIVLPIYKPDFLQLALQSLANQTCQDFTAYLCDDCSPFDIASIVRQFEGSFNFKYIRYSENLGGKDLVKQWQRCINSTEDEPWIWLFSDDDVMQPQCVESFFTARRQHPNQALFHFNVTVIDEKGNATTDNHYLKPDFPSHLSAVEYLRGRLAYRYNSFAVEYIFSRQLYNESLGFVPYDMAWGSDDATWFRFAQNANGIITIPEARVFWRFSNSNISPDHSAATMQRKLAATQNHLSFCKRVLPKSKMLRLRYFVHALFNARSIGILKLVKAILNYLTPTRPTNLLIIGMSMLPFLSSADNQDPESNTLLHTTITTEAAVGSGDYTPYYLTSNRHGILDSRANTGYIRADLQYNRTKGKWNFEAGLDIQVSAHAYSKFYLQQCYLTTTWQWLQFTAGSKELTPLVRDFRLSSGNLTWSGNSRPIPQLRIGTNGFVDIPFTRHWVQIYLDGSYGRQVDDDYLESEYAQYLQGKTGYGRSWITTEVWSHQKKAFLRSNPHHPFVLSAGIEHAVQFGGYSRNYIDPTLDDVRYTPTISDFFRVIMPTSGSDNSASGDQSFVYGNHLGDITAMLEYQWGNNYQYRVGVYGENPFEDGSGMRKGNGWDGLWGIEYHNQDPDSWLTGIVCEYLQTTNQSGPIHWSPHDYAGLPIGEVAHSATGCDDYYNNYFYAGYAHFGQSCGSPMLKSPAYNNDHYLRFTDNRVRAFHIGLEGTIKSSLSYRVLASHRSSYGTYFDPAPTIRYSTDWMLELTYHSGPWTAVTSFAGDHGELYGNNTAVAFRLSYSFNN